MASSVALTFRRSPLVAIMIPFVWALVAVGAEPIRPSSDPQLPLSIELDVLELPQDAVRRFAVAERLADLGLVLSDAEARKLAELSLVEPRVVENPAASVQTSVGRSAVLRGSAGGRTVACVVVPESASSEGDITLRVVPLPASRSPLELAAENHEAMFALSRTSATVQLKRGEAMMFGGWKAGADQANTILAIVKPSVVDATAISVASASGSSMRTMRVEAPGTKPSVKPGNGPGPAREVAAADGPPAAGASPAPVVQSPSPSKPGPTP